MYVQNFTYKMSRKGLLRTKVEVIYVHILYDKE